MDKKVKDVFKVSCNWYLDDNERNPMIFANTWVIDSNDKVKGAWVGKIVVYDDNSCVGYVTDNNNKKPSSILIGTLIGGKALSLCTINAEKLINSPIIYHTFSNSLANNFGMNDSYYGEFFQRNVYGNYNNFDKLGSTSFTATKQSDISETKKIEEIYEKLAKQIRELGSTGGFLRQVEHSNQEQTNYFLETYAKRILHADLPIELQEEIFTAKSKGE